MQSPVICISSGSHRSRVLAHRDELVVENLHLVAPIARRVHATLPPSFDLDDLEAAGNLALLRAATRYRPAVHGGTPFSAYARACIEGAMKDTFRANKFAEQTRAPLDNVLEFPCTRPHIDESIDLARRFAALRDHVTSCLSPLQVRVIDEYYSPRLPDLATVAVVLGIKRKSAENAHAAAIRTLRARLAAGAPSPPTVAA